MTFRIGGNRTSRLFGTILTTQVVEGKFYNLRKKPPGINIVYNM